MYELIIGGSLSHSANTNSSGSEQLLQIREFVDKSAGLQSKTDDDLFFKIFQRTDGKSMSFEISKIEEVINRTDTDGQPFLQVNFENGKKILITDNLVGFKPVPCIGLDMSKLPKVVTTPDLLSVVEAIEETMSLDGVAEDEVDVLRKVFHSVLQGAEAVGFDLTSERVWLQSLGRLSNRLSA